MSGFAGSGSLDDRRRRRLATSADQLDTTRGHSAPRVGLHEVEEDTRFDPTLVRLRDLTPLNAWKTAATIVGMVLLAVAAVVASHSPELQAGQFGDAVAHFFDLGQGQAIRFLSVATLISAAHFALVIGTVRSHSPRDFRGRFRIWRWAAALFVGAAVMVGTDLHLVFSDLVRQWTGATYHGWVRLNWLIPFAIVATIISWKLWLDMRLSPPSLICLGLAVISAIALLASDQLVSLTGYAHIVLVAQLALGVSLFAAMLTHMRFVSHVNPNPPEPKPVRQTPNAQPKMAAESFSNPTPQETTPARPSRTRKGVHYQPAAAHSDFDEFEEDAPKRKTSKRNKRTRRDGPAPESLKGMTKKQRKLARKQFREEQRAMEKGYDS